MTPNGQQLKFAYTINSTPAYPKFKPRASLGLGITQVIVGTVSILLQIGGIAKNVSLYYVGVGIWAGIPFVFAGVFGIEASRSKSKRSVLTVLVMSIVCSVLAGAMVINQTIALVFILGLLYYQHDRETSLAICTSLLLLGFMEMIMAIIQSAFCCGSSCCVSRSPPTQVIFVNHPNGQPIGAESRVVYNHRTTQSQLQGRQLYIFSQGQMMPVVALPPESVESSPTDVSEKRNSIKSTSTNHISKTNAAQPKPKTQRLPHSMQNGTAAKRPTQLQLTTEKRSPPPAYDSNPDLRKIPVQHNSKHNTL